MRIEILKADVTVYKGEVVLAQFPGLDGSFEVLTNHAPLVASLKKGQLKLKHESGEFSSFDIEGGILEVNKNSILVLAL